MAPASEMQRPQATRIVCPSRICAVTVYARGALVTRRLELPDALPEGALELVVEGVSPVAEPGSLRVDLKGSGDVLGVSSRLVVPGEGEVPGALLARLRALRMEKQRLEVERAELSERRGLIGQVEPDLGMRPRSRFFDAGARMDDALAVVDLADALRAELDTRLSTLEQRLTEHERTLAAAELEAEQARSSALAGRGHPTRCVTLRLGAERGEIEQVEITYAIAAARWWPTYTVRLDNESHTATLAVEAFVAQLSLEDWDEVEIALATADLHRDTALPELPTWRMGRAQPPPRSGYRPAPPDLDALFDGYDAARNALDEGQRKASRPPPAPRSETQLLAYDSEGPMPTVAVSRPGVMPTTQVSYQFTDGEDGDSAPGFAMQDVFAQQSMPMPQAMPAPKRGSSVLGGLAAAAAAPVAAGVAAYDLAKKGRARRSEAAPASGGAAESFAEQDAIEVAAEIEPAEGWLDFDRLVMRSGDAGPDRGKLEPRTAPAGSGPTPAQAAAQLDSAGAPGAVHDPLSARGEFDHLYRGSAPVEVASGTRPCRITLASESAPVRSRFRCVPVETPEVFREIELDNPFDAPLLAGPLDVFIGGAMVTTSALEAVDRGGRVVFGLGVEERLRTARNARVTEHKGGIFGGRVVIEHVVELELASALGHEARVELVDRVPVRGDEDDEIEIALVESTPEAEPYDQAERGSPVEGGLRWQLTVPPGGRSQVRFRYDLTLSAKREIIGGNRRD